MSHSYEFRVVAEAQVGVVTPLPGAGTPLEQTYVYDAAARAIKDMAATGRLEISEETKTPEGLISYLAFKKLS